MKRLVLSLSRSALAALVLALLAQQADAASTSITIVVTGPASTAVNCTVNYPSGQTSFTAPVAAGTAIAGCSVSPATWSGALSLSGPDASFFAVDSANPLNIDVGSAALTDARSYNVTVNATP